jgi:hypothetical protein
MSPSLKWPSRWRLPRYLRAIPLPALRLIGLLVLVNAIVWAAAGILLRKLTCWTIPENHQANPAQITTPN